MKTYKYHPLDQAKKEIRLLVLESINHKGELNYRVEHRSLLHEPDKQYSAVSYRWGRKLDQVTLRLDGEPFQVPRSAAAALRGTHQTANPTMYDGDSDSDEHDRYWIDVICIDQANLEEKASQVAMMGEIYTRAARTLVWLGEEPSCCTSWLAFSLLDAMYEHIKKNTRGLAVLGEHLWSEREEDSRKYRASSLEMPVGDDWHGVNCLFAREWFRRLWCIQEVALSRQTICCWGTSSMDFEVVSLIARWLVSVRNWRQEASSKGVSEGGRKGIDNAACMWDQWKGGLSPKLDMLLYTSYWCETSDPLDKVYGFLGIWRARATVEIATTPEHLTLLRPDYRSSMAKVYADASRAVILVSKNLALLDVTDAGRLDADLPEVPSWVPRLDLGYSSHYSPEVFSTHSVGASGGMEAAVCTDNRSWDVLKVRGVIVSEVSEIQATPPAGDWTIDTSMAIVQWMISKAHATYGTEALRLAAETLTVRNDPTAVDAYLEHLEHASERDESLPQTQSPHDSVHDKEEANSVLDRLHNACALWARARAIFYTRGGHVGIVKASVLPRDIVCILFGSRKPVVLRPYGDGWSFVGVAFVYGIMDGEYIQLLEDEGLLEHQAQWFSIR